MDLTHETLFGKWSGRARLGFVLAAALIGGKGYAMAQAQSRPAVRNIEAVVCPHGETGPNNLRNSEGAAIELKDGRLLMAYTHFYGGGADDAAGDIFGKTSTDGGLTWSKPFQIQSNTARYNTGRLALIRLSPAHGGLLAHIYVDLNTRLDLRILFRTSIDEGQSWSREVQINQIGTLGLICQRGDTALVLRSGRILVPVYGMFGDLCASFMYFSDDGGVTWQRSQDEISVKVRQDKQVVAYTYFEEPAVAQLRDGRLLCFGRTNTGRLWQSISTDQGVTWGQAEPTELASSYSPACLKTIPGTGDLLCIWNQASAEEIRGGHGRCRMSCAISADDGKTWGHFRNLESLNDVKRIEPPPLGAVADTSSETQAKAIRVNAITWPQDGSRTPLDPARYPIKGYPHVDYPSCTFTRDNHVVIMYGVYGGAQNGLTDGNKVVIHPVQWLYQ